GKVERDLRLNELGLAARDHVQLHHEVAVRLESPRQTFRQQRRRLAGRPTQEVAVRVNSGPKNDSVVAWRRILFVELPRCRRCINADVGVMHARITGLELDAADVAERIYWYWEDEHSGYVRPVCGKRVRLREGHDEIRRAELPGRVPDGCARKISTIAFTRALGHPSSDERDLFV